MFLVPTTRSSSTAFNTETWKGKSYYNYCFEFVFFFKNYRPRVPWRHRCQILVLEGCSPAGLPCFPASTRLICLNKSLTGSCRFYVGNSITESSILEQRPPSSYVENWSRFSKPWKWLCMISGYISFNVGNDSITATLNFILIFVKLNNL